MSDARAVSTVVDVSTCLLLVSAAVVTLALATPPPAREEPNGARRAATVLGASTEHVEYRPRGPASPGRDGGNRTAEGTLAGLLADAALVDARLTDGDRRPEGFVARTCAAIERATRPVDADVRVVATWRPVPEAPVHGRVAVGDRPPPTAAVDAVELTVPVGENVTARARRAAERGGRDALARVLARATLEVAFGPPAAGPDGRAPPRRSAAYRRFARTYGLDLPDEDEAASLRAALLDELARRYRATLPTDENAQDGLAVGRVTVTVRAWSA